MMAHYPCATSKPHGYSVFLFSPTFGPLVAPFHSVRACAQMTELNRG